MPGALLIDHDLGEQDVDGEDDRDDNEDKNRIGMAAMRKRTMVLLSNVAVIVMVEF